MPDIGAMPAAQSTTRPLRPDAVKDWIFDLDNTLYPASSNLFREIDRRIIDFMARYLATEHEAAAELKLSYRQRYGSSMRGLMVEHDVEPGEFLGYVHDIDLTLIAPDPELGTALGKLPGRKLIFTNASTRHAENVLRQLGIADRFAEIFDIAAADYVPKPQPAAYQALVECHDIVPSEAVFVEDLAVNLAPAAALGMTTVWVAPDGGAEAAAGGEHVHHVVENLVVWLRRLAGLGATGER